MRWKLAALLVVLSISLVAASPHDLTPTEVSKIKVYDSKPLYRIPQPVIYGDRLYTIGGQGDTLIAMDLNGEKLWSIRIGARVSTPPLVIPDAFYGYAKKESWVIVTTDSFELRAYNSVAGELRIERLRLPSAPSGSPMAYLNDGRTIVVPLTSSLQAVDLRSKSTGWSMDLGFRIRHVHYVNGGAIIYGDARIAYVDLNSHKLVWDLELGERILVAGDDPSFIGVMLQNGTMISISTSTGEPVARRDMTEILGYEFPYGMFPVVDGIGALTSSKETILFVNLSDLSVSRPIKTWIPPASQPVAAGKALLYFSKSGEVRIYHYTQRFLLSEFKVSNPPFSLVTISEIGNHTTSVSYIDGNGDLHLLRLPDHWIKVQKTEPKDGGYLVEGFVCSTALSGERSKIVLYVMSQQGEVIGEKTIGFLTPGRCGARFSTMLKDKGALGLVVGEETLPPNAPIGLTREEWISLKGGAPVTTTTAPTTTTTTKPAAQLKLEVQAPSQLVVGDGFKLNVSGINSWGVEELTFVIKGPTIQGEEVTEKLGPGSEFSVSIEGRALNPGTGATLYIKHGDEVLYEKEIPVRVEQGKVIEEVRASEEAKVNSSIIVTVKLVNRFRDNAQFILVTSLDGSPVERKVGPLRAGGSAEVHVKVIPRKTGDLQLRVQALAGGKIVDERTSTITVTVTTPSTPPIVTTQQPALPIPLEYLVGGIIGAVLILIAIALLLGSRKPREVKMEEMKPITAPTIEEAAVEEISEVKSPSTIPPEIEQEEMGIEVPKVRRIEMEEAPKLEAEEEGKLTPPEMEEEIPTIKPEIMEERVVPEEVRESLERELESVKKRLDDVRRSVSKLEEIVGFELSPYRLVDAETMLVSAELKLKEGDVSEAERIINSVKESLDVLEAEVSEAEKVFLENWSAVENRIDIMLRVWGKAPANMLTMVPAGFRIHALERFRKLHPDRKLELRGDELISLEE
ncbi:MAG: hypothetical protein QI197_01925 [Candidatus Korarchaeota archaeon]|nr:hypothetical protein [Candidatus Korarchaeota archaeon]